MPTDSGDAGVNLSLTQDEALVLFDWLGNNTEHQFANQAEQRVLWDLEVMLESTPTAPFRSDYDALLAAARARVRDSTN